MITGPEGWFRHFIVDVIVVSRVGFPVEAFGEVADIDNEGFLSERPTLIPVPRQERFVDDSFFWPLYFSLHSSRPRGDFMVKPFFSRKFPLGGNVAVAILVVVAFVVPLLARSAKLGMENITNNVADWLPKHYQETVDLEEFRKHFYGDQFVVVSGPWCHEGNPHFNLFRQKLLEESLEYEKILRNAGRDEEIRAHRKGDELGLMIRNDNVHKDWGTKQEKWLQGRDKQWYFVDRQGQLFRWKGQNNVVEAVQRHASKQPDGRHVADGFLIDQFGPPPDLNNGKENPFYQSPEKLCCRPFKSVVSGLEVFEQIGGENGTLRISANDTDELAAFDAEIEAHQRLTGAMFGITPPKSYNWSWASLLKHVGKEKLRILQSSPVHRQRFEAFVAEVVENEFNGSRAELAAASQKERLRLWYRLWYQLELDAPPRQTCLVVTLNEPIIAEMDRAVGRPVPGKPRRGRILELAISKCGIDEANIHIGGPPADNVAIDEEGTSTLVKLIKYSALIGITIALLCFRKISLTFMIFFVGGVAAMGSLAIVWMAGDSMDAILMSMPSLVYVLGLSGAVHLVNYYRDACHEDGPELAAETAVLHCIGPCSLAALTTALGLYSLTTSSLSPIFKFGKYSAFATVATVFLLFTFLPAALTLFKPGFKKLAAKERENDQSVMARIGAFWDGVGDVVIRNWRGVMAMGLVVMMVGIYGITKVETQVHLLKLFDPGAKILQDYRWMEKNLGELVPAEIVIGVDTSAQREVYLEAQDTEAREAYQRAIANAETEAERKELEEDEPVAKYDDRTYDMRLSMLERIELSGRVRGYLEKFFGPEGTGDIGSGMSTDVFTPSAGESQEASVRRDVYSSRLYESRDEMAMQDYYTIIGRSKVGAARFNTQSIDREELGREMWRISIRLAALNDVDYGKFIGDLKAVIEPVMTAYRFRKDILTAVHDAADEAAKDPESADKPIRVLVLGPDPTRYDTDIKDELARGESVSNLIDQTFIFGDTLRDLMENRGILKKKGDKLFTWLDPSYATPDNPKLSQKARENVIKLREELKTNPEYVGGVYDCVVLIKDDEMFDVDFLKQHAKRFIDCRDHQYLIDPHSKSPLAGMQTAKELREGGQPVEISAIYTGIVPIVYKAQRSLLWSLIQSILLAFIMISVIMMVYLRDWRSPLRRENLLNFRGGMTAMIPNIFPVVVVFGIMGLYGIKVDIGSMMTASVAMGIAVDDTIHYLTWYRHALAKGRDRVGAIKYAYEKVATAMTQTTLIGGLGLAAFCLSTFTPTQRFGTLMLFLLFAALVGDLIVLPAVLASPLGKYFGRELSDSERAKLDLPNQDDSLRVVGNHDEPLLGTGS